MKAKMIRKAPWYLEYMSKKGENTTRIMASDIPMIVTVILYVITTILIIYKII